MDQYIKDRHWLARGLLNSPLELYFVTLLFWAAWGSLFGFDPFIWITSYQPGFPAGAAAGLLVTLCIVGAARSIITARRNEERLTDAGELVDHYQQTVNSLRQRLANSQDAVGHLKQRLMERQVALTKANQFRDESLADAHDKYMEQVEYAKSLEERIDQLSNRTEGAPRVDIWELQRHLMGISGQVMHELPTLSKHSICYLAFSAEEFGETLEATAELLLKTTPLRALEYAPLATMLDQGKWLRSYSKVLRKAIEHGLLDGISMQMTPEQAKPILDGVADTTVTIAGFAVAAGFPGRDAFVEVNSSNASKANPETGRIDIDPSGKWIKGPNFREPDLLRVLQLQATDRDLDEALDSQSAGAVR